MPPPFDLRIADGHLGKYILVGITHLDHEGNEIRRMQVHGVVEKAAPDGITDLQARRHLASHGRGKGRSFRNYSF